MKTSIYQVDAFTEEMFKGNPAAICPLDNWLEKGKMQSIAAENNLAETAFFVKENNKYHIRWFTPEKEIDLCGHATLAAAHVILNYIDTDLNQVKFQSLSGCLEVFRENDMLTMIFPARPAGKCDIPKTLISALGSEPAAVYKSRDYMVVYDDEEQIKNINPDIAQLKKIDSLGIIITAEGEDVDFVSRFFAPSCGVPEDPVTGSAHCTLIPYWGKKLGKSKLKAEQLSKRGGQLYCEDLGDKVKISGQAVLYLRGTIYIGS